MGQWLPVACIYSFTSAQEKKLDVGFEVAAQAGDGLGVKLIRPGFGDGKYRTDLFEGQPLMVVERDHHALSIRKPVDSRCQGALPISDRGAIHRAWIPGRQRVPDPFLAITGAGL